MRLSVVIPVFNEEESLDLLFKSLYDALEAVLFDWQIVFIDDGSHDGSLSILEKYAHILGKELVVQWMQICKMILQIFR